VVRFDEKDTCPFFLEEQTLAGDTSVAMMENTLCVVPLWEQFSSQTVHHFTSLHFTSVFFVPFWTRNFLIIGPIPWYPRSPHLTTLYFLFWGFIKDISSLSESAKYE
jgi:hypothetical protein